MYKRTLIFLIVSAGLMTANAAEVFSPKDCEFSVSFPSKFDTNTIFSPSGESTTQAKNPNGLPVKLSAECWPVQQITPADYAKSISKKISEKGIEVQNVIISKGNLGEIVTLTGIAGSEGQKYYLKFESFWGERTRLDLVVIEKTPIASKEHLLFRNSVRIK